MATCNDTKVGDVYECKVCGWEFEVKKACGCDCKLDVNCCGRPVVRKEPEQPAAE